MAGGRMVVSQGRGQNIDLNKPAMAGLHLALFRNLSHKVQYVHTPRL